MKVQIELEELESIRLEAKKYKDKYNQLFQFYELLQPNEINKETTERAIILFREYTRQLFESLGFDSGMEPYFGLHINDSLQVLRRWKDITPMEKVTFNIGATLTHNAKQAFLNIGIDTDKF